MIDRENATLMNNLLLDTENNISISNPPFRTKQEIKLKGKKKKKTWNDITWWLKIHFG